MTEKPLQYQSILKNGGISRLNSCMGREHLGDKIDGASWRVRGIGTDGRLKDRSFVPLSVQ